MADIEISHVQDKSINLKVQQGNDVIIPIKWKNPNDSPLVLTSYTFVCEIRDNYRSAGGVIVATITDTPNANNDVLVVDALNGKTDIYIGNATTNGLKHNGFYLVELKLVLNSRAVRNIVIRLQIVPEVTT
jgi:hypothetical protein